MKKVAVLGAGPMGLAAAFHLAKAGHSVEVFEADDRPGGMAAHFDFGGLSLERYYHFICKDDHAHFDLLAELGLLPALKWRGTSMGYFFQGRHFRWGDPFALLRFSPLGLISRLRYGLHMLYCTRFGNWRELDKLDAEQWIRKWIGDRGWAVLWQKLFTLKFFEFSGDISAAWIWTRIRRIGRSRKSLFQEELGYLEGGSETLVRGLVENITRLGGKLHLSCPAAEVVIENGAVSAVVAGGERRPFDAVISTVPLPLVPRLMPGLPEPMKQQYANTRNIGVVCVVHKLARRVSPHFWLNINDDRIEIPGLVEFSNLRPLPGQHIAFVPYYMPVTHAKFQWSDAALIDESFGYLQMLNADLTRADLLDSHVSRLRYAQPICQPRYLESVPPVRTPVRGLQIADTSSYYPEDRGISESVRLAREMAAQVS